MNVPRPHASFPLGDTIPFTVTLLTNEHGQKWEPKRDEAAGFRLKALLTREGFPEQRWSFGFTPVTGSTSSHIAQWTPQLVGSSAVRVGLYRYVVTLERIDPKDGYTVRSRYTLLRGNLTLY